MFDATKKQIKFYSLHVQQNFGYLIESIIYSSASVVYLQRLFNMLNLTDWHPNKRYRNKGEKYETDDCQKSANTQRKLDMRIR